MKNHFIYINLDGFGRYYFDAVSDKRREIPNIMSLIGDGVFFENARTGIPSITYPMQSSIISGAFSGETGNCDQYFDREKNEVVLLKRHNNSQTAGELLRELNIPCVSIQQFTLLDRGCEYGNKDFLYIQPGGDAAVRLNKLKELILNNRIEYKSKVYEYDSLPKAVFAYVDDLDTIGHNPDYYSAYDEKDRVWNVLARLRYIDDYLGGVLSALKSKNLYDSTYILLTTDHGMISYTGESLIPSLAEKLRSLGFCNICAVSPGQPVPPDYDVVLTSHGIECQIYFRLEHDFAFIKNELLKEAYIEAALTKTELISDGVSPLFADLLVSPVEGRHFSIGKNPIKLCATHDSLNDKCQRIFAMMKGPEIKKSFVCKEPVRVIDFLPTVLYALGLPKLRNAKGKIIKSVFND